MNRTNCWEHKQCGRQPGGNHTKELGVCPVATFTATHGMNSGINGGRSCWAIEGTLCGGTVQGTFAQKMSSCMQCDFYELVRREEGSNYKGSREIIQIINCCHNAGAQNLAGTGCRSSQHSSI